MRCAGSHHHHIGHAPQRTRDRLPRGYCPICNRSHALTRTGRIWPHNTPSQPIPDTTSSRALPH